MNATEKLEREVNKIGGEYGTEIIASVKALAEIDVEIKSMLDEIERIDDELVQRHNELADIINSLIVKAVDNNDAEEAEESPDSQEKGNQECVLKIDMKVRVTKTSQ